MSFTNINDPAGVKALLDSLRASQAWAETISSSPNTNATALDPATNPSPLLPPPVPPVTVGQDETSPEAGPPSSGSTTSVAALLSQLQASSSAVPSAHPPEPPRRPAVVPPTPIQTRQPSIPYVPNEPAQLAPTPSSARRQDLRSLTFQQALPHLVKLAEDPSFVEAVTKMKQDQERLEQRLWDERESLKKTHEEKVKLAKTKASLVGACLSKHEADMLSDGFRRELKKFDAERAIPAWDGLIGKQQTVLEALGVPSMFPTSSRAEREKQQRVMQVVQGVVGGDG
ncbi:hypothetical protein EVG20_g7480 [Dentipellis fragilis]|uniref:Uncharacterized protein n=1 Tax=Dentipellis fragilis TaxID=205917 RepID=A0A4Y9YFP8_9AGAM|nr:hypothetical protein EVG20_g7480 [Dentipellis fragilis]